VDGLGLAAGEGGGALGGQEFLVRGAVGGFGGGVAGGEDGVLGVEFFGLLFDVLEGEGVSFCWGWLWRV